MFSLRSPFPPRTTPTNPGEFALGEEIVTGHDSEQVEDSSEERDTGGSLDDNDIGIKEHEAVLGLSQNMIVRKVRSSSSLEAADMLVSSPPPDVAELGDPGDESFEAMEGIWKGQDSSNDSRSSASDPSEGGADDRHQEPSLTNNTAINAFSTLPPLLNIASRGYSLQSSSTIFKTSDIRRQLWGYSNTSDDPLLQAYNLQQTARGLHSTISDQIAPSSSQQSSTPRPMHGGFVPRSSPSLPQSAPIYPNAVNNVPENRRVPPLSQQVLEEPGNGSDSDDSDQPLNEVDGRLFERFDLDGVSRKEFKNWLRHAPAEELAAARLELQNECLLETANEDSKTAAELDQTGGILGGKFRVEVDDPPSLQHQNGNGSLQKASKKNHHSALVLPSRGLTVINNVQKLPRDLFLSLVRSQVEFYAKNHEFFKSSHVPHTTTERRDFTRGVYDYARARGMSSAESQTEVKRIGKACRKNRRIAKVLQWIDIANEEGRSMEDELQRIRDEEGWDTDEIEGNFPDDESDAGTNFGTEIDDSAEFLKEAAKMVQSKLGDSKPRSLLHKDLLRMKTASRVPKEARESDSVKSGTVTKQKRSRLGIKPLGRALMADEQQPRSISVELEQVAKNLVADLAAKEAVKIRRAARKKRKREETKDVTRNKEGVDGKAIAESPGRTKSEKQGKSKSNQKELEAGVIGEAPCEHVKAIPSTQAACEAYKTKEKRKRSAENIEAAEEEVNLEMPKKKTRNKKKERAEKSLDIQSGNVANNVEAFDVTVRGLLDSEEGYGGTGTPATIDRGEHQTKIATSVEEVVGEQTNKPSLTSALIQFHATDAQTDPQDAKKEKKRVKAQRRENKAPKPHNGMMLEVENEESSHVTESKTRELEARRAKEGPRTEDRSVQVGKKSKKSRQRVGMAAKLERSGQVVPGATRVGEAERVVEAQKTGSKEKDGVEKVTPETATRVSELKQDETEEALPGGEPLVEHTGRAERRKRKNTKATETDSITRQNLGTTPAGPLECKDNTKTTQKEKVIDNDTTQGKEKKKRRLGLDERNDVDGGEGASSSNKSRRKAKPLPGPNDMGQDKDTEKVSMKKSRKARGDRLVSNSQDGHTEKSGFH